MELNIEKLQTLLGVMVNELGAAQNSALVIIGEELGLYRKMAERGAISSIELAEATDTKERYVREWLAAQAASGFVDYDAATGRFTLSPEQAAVFAVEDSPVNMIGGFVALDAIYADRAKLTHAFRHGGGVSWTDRCNCMFCGTDRFFRPGYKANLVESWLPSMEGVVEKLERGAQVADIGCGFGSSTLLMARAFPKSQFTGLDFHAHSIEHASRHAKGMSNVRFETARAQDFEGAGFDLVTIFDALHDMGDPVGAVRHIARALKPEGTLMLVEPMAGDSLAENLNPVGRVFYAASANTCVPASLGQEVGAALGAQAGQAKLTEVLKAGGFSKVRRATETPFNMVLEARL
ncbi:class I SAM-dependent methyltransferase [Rhizobium laguerreae]|uniref:Ubiquinone/menaquinone biosynthesis C-methylase UbiE n=1 Tax=Rhizobium laguerreae TaxID=1076926 RepID=A0ABR6G3Z8_9HYPH|nr:class I SAM-dependent methyltransferase [Rhizobium laguerreae]MBB3160082.1 ubiquinone/menaquinone biosynthesis C-methylase UbiE [Rhizobium laguerreae]MBY3117383.1 class I SAM-dependent methyltransferase [Rhizobium laguerreae]MBY3261107.1 class I SAM-dependent methyltransferase [Rhizobium laguerreae]MBY3336415.1 class I SAM-dependent methyltransferase [Rhizobium laguerreae]OOO48172.1 SAM-dependent methyltransferase [Rhizobium laguerreae]